MSEWEQPHWSGRPQAVPDQRPRLRPNAFARLARVCARHNAAVLIATIFAVALCVTYAALRLSINPQSASRIVLDPLTQAAQERLDSNFPGIESTFVASFANSADPAAARGSAVAVAAALVKRSDLYAAAFVPGTGPYYVKYGFLFHDRGDIDDRVAQALRLQPLYQALGQAPDIAGLAVLVGEIGKAVAQGRSPPGLANMLLAFAETVEGEIAGVSKPVPWLRLAGLSADMESRRWFVVATPAAGQHREAARFAVSLTTGMPDVQWSFPAQVYGRQGNLVRDVLVPAIAAVLMVVTILAMGLGAARFVIPVLIGTITSLALSSAAAALVSPVLDGVGWSFAAACLAPAFLFTLIVVLAHVQARVRGAQPLAAIMIAAHRHGAQVLMLALAFEALWSTWLFRQLPSLAGLAQIVAYGTAMAAVVSLTVVPAVLAVLDRDDDIAVHWLDAAAAQPLGSNGRNFLQVVVLVLFAAGVFCTVFVPGLRFGDAPRPLLPAAALDTPAAQEAIHLLATDEAQVRQLIAAAGQLPEVGAIRTIGQFLPNDLDLKLASLKRLDNYLSGVPSPRQPVDQAANAATFAALEDSLKQIAADPATAPDLRDAAHRLRRAVTLYSNPQMPSAGRVTTLEDALFAGLGDLAWGAGQLAKLDAPQIGDLDDGLRQRFVSQAGLLRVEVLPKPGIGRLAFAAAMRRIEPLAAGTPIVALARNEIMHHEAAIAFAAAFAAAALVMLILLRNVLDWMVTLAPAGLGLSLSAAVLVGTGQVLDATSLGTATTAIALCLSASAMMTLRARQRSRQSPSGTAFRAALLPQLVILATIAPLATSGIASVAWSASTASLFLLIAAVVSLLVTPRLYGWAEVLRRR